MNSNSNAPLTLTEFLESTGAQLRFYDLGRRVTPIPRDLFLDFERSTEPYPYPMQQKAWFAIVQEYLHALSEPVIWFLRFDLDEQAKLVLAIRDYLMHRFIEIASGPSGESGLGEAMKDNPYAFAPREDKMANLHARVHRDLGLGPSQYYAHARDYLQGKPGWEQWSFVGYQGLADIAARQDENDTAATLVSALPHLPQEPLVALCQCLENYALGDGIAQALRERFSLALADSATSPALLAALLRGQAHAPSPQTADVVLELLGDARSSDPEVLAAIGGRLWEVLQQPEVATAYLEKLASDDVTQEVFDLCLTDLLRMPTLQQRILNVIRAPERSKPLADAFQAMLQR